MDWPWICTLSCVAHLADAQALHQVFAIWRSLRLDQALSMPPHRAGARCLVTANLLVEMLKEATIEQMVALDVGPKLLPRVTSAKHRGIELGRRFRWTICNGGWPKGHGY